MFLMRKNHEEMIEEYSTDKHSKASIGLVTELHGSNSV